MRLASYTLRGRSSFGVVVGDGLVDLRPRLAPRYTSVLDLLRGDGMAEVQEVVRRVRPDFGLDEAEMLPPVIGGEKILCIGINYANRNADYGEANVPQYPSMFYRAPNSMVGHRRPLLLM